MKASFLFKQVALALAPWLGPFQIVLRSWKVSVNTLSLVPFIQVGLPPLPGQCSFPRPVLQLIEAEEGKSSHHSTRMELVTSPTHRSPTSVSFTSSRASQRTPCIFQMLPILGDMPVVYPHAPHASVGTFSSRLIRFREYQVQPFHSLIHVADTSMHTAPCTPR